MPTRGIDISNHQRDVDWAKIARDGIRFAWCKATEGETFDDPWWPRNRREAAAHGIRVGGYHFGRPGNNPHADARHFLRIAKPKLGELLPVLDLERTDGQSPAQLRRWASEWLDHVAREIGDNPVFYSYPYFITTSMGGAHGLGDHPLWLASYGPNDGDRHGFQVVGPWHHAAAHQYTSRGHVDGVNGDCDLNVLVAATLDDLTYQRKETPVPTIWPPGDGTFWQWLQWRLGEGHAKEYGPGKAPRPNVPRRIPTRWWARARDYLAARKDDEPTTPKWQRTLVLASPHMSGDDVEVAQRALEHNPYGDFYDGTIDGDYGPLTAAATREAQRMLGYRTPRAAYGQGLHRFLTGDAKLTKAMQARRHVRLAEAASRPNIGERALEIARQQIGHHETPDGSNIALPYTRWYGWIGWGAPWCAVFVSWCLERAGSNAVSPEDDRWAYCPYMVADAVAGRNGLKVVKHPKPGDVVLYDWQRRGLGGVSDHVGLFEKWTADDTFTAVEGNTGNAVRRETRRRDQVVCFARVTR